MSQNNIDLFYPKIELMLVLTISIILFFVGYFFLFINLFPGEISKITIFFELLLVFPDFAIALKFIENVIFGICNKNAGIIVSDNYLRNEFSFFYKKIPLNDITSIEVKKRKGVPILIECAMTKQHSTVSILDLVLSLHSITKSTNKKIKIFLQIYPVNVRFKIIDSINKKLIFP